MEIKNRNVKFALITLGVITVVATPAILLTSIHAIQSINNHSPILDKLNEFYANNEAVIFSKLNFIINAPLPNISGEYTVANLELSNIVLNENNKSRLNNYQYDIEITKIIPNSNGSGFRFEYKVFPIVYKDISITKWSEEYFQYVSADGTRNYFTF